MESAAIACSGRKVTCGAIGNAVRKSGLLSDALKAFAEARRVTGCSTGCGGFHDRIFDILADFMHRR